VSSLWNDTSPALRAPGAAAPSTPVRAPCRSQVRRRTVGATIRRLGLRGSWGTVRKGSAVLDADGDGTRTGDSRCRGQSNRRRGEYPPRRGGQQGRGGATASAQAAALRRSLPAWLSVLRTGRASMCAPVTGRHVSAQIVRLRRSRVERHTLSRNCRRAPARSKHRARTQAGGVRDGDGEPRRHRGAQCAAQRQSTHIRQRTSHSITVSCV